jgi:formylglycine-generating enzyme required for sulfatase activity
MAGRIFVSYRRDDDPGFAGRVRDILAERFGANNVFMDVDNLIAGRRFDAELAKALATCDVFIAIIGARWTDLLRERLASGERDWVLEEIAEALKRRIAVIPLRVGREGQLPALPRPGDLPELVRDLIQYQKHDVTHERFGADIGGLCAAVAEVRRDGRGWRLRARWAAGAGVVGSLAVLCAGAYFTGTQVWRPWQYQDAPVLGQQSGPKAALGQTVSSSSAKPVERAKQTAPSVDPALALFPGSGNSLRDCAVVCPEMVVVPAGRFTMGAPPGEIDYLEKRHNARFSTLAPQHEVTFAHNFAVGKFLVTFNEWDACVADGGCDNYSPGDQGWGRGRRPVINISWHDAQAYATWLSDKTGESYRLLSEAEWEYVARAGTTTAYYWGDRIDQPDRANCGECGNKEGGNQTTLVGSFRPNPWGLFDIVGNANQWLEDCWHDSYEGAPTDGSAWTAGCEKVSRINRGGSWDFSGDNVRSSFRIPVHANARIPSTGFRVARWMRAPGSR